MEKPADLGPAGSELWDEVMGQPDLLLRADEMRLLELACRQLDTIADLREAFAADPRYMVKGSTGQPVINPLLAEIRTASGAFASLMRQLGIPDSEERAAQKAELLSQEARERANIRWRKAKGA